MNRYLLASLLGPSVLLLGLPATAQTQPNAQPGQAQPNAARSQQACDELMGELRGTPIAERPVSLRQAREDRRAGNAEACRGHLQAIRSSSNDRQSEAEGAKQDRGGQITIRQQSPRVTVQPGRPEVFIQQQRPTVTVEIPPPRVTVRMPQPDLNVVGSQGQERQLSMDRSFEPQVRYERAQPRVVIRETQSQPEVKFERAEASGTQTGTENANPRTAQQPNQAREETDQSTANRKQPQSTARAGPQNAADRRVLVSSLLEMSLYDGGGMLLGDVERVVQSGGQTSLVIGRGGFLGMGEKQIAIPVNTVTRNGDRLIAQQYTAAQAERAQEWSNPNNATDLDDQQSVTLGGT